MKLDEYVTLGRTGVLVSPLCLGAMTFGNDWGWGAEEPAVQRMIDTYLDRGGNFIDTADGYTGGSSERMLGRYMAERGNRDQIVLATKFTFHAGMNPSATAVRGNPNLGGNSRKNIYRALEASLRRLQTDYIDLYWMHVWDGVTPVEEVMSTIDFLVREGKIRYFGLSDVPAWYATRGQTLAELRGQSGIAALQLEYSLTERGIEREHIPAARELGMAVCPWSPLSSGFLSGKYKRNPDGDQTEGRLAKTTMFDRFGSERNWAILDVVLEAAKQLGKSPAEVALNWVATRPGVTSTIIGVTKPEQLDSNIAALDVAIPPEFEAKLDDVSKLTPNHPYSMFQPAIRARIHGGAAVRRWTP